ncbi:MAG: phosphotriesterase [Chloroflexi bacterium]|nr:phosphotriesterase [Chloroflexota bacterium]
MATTINTVLGPISTADLGGMLTHEHLLASPMGVEYDTTLPFDREGQLLNLIGDMKELRAAGISSIIDPIPIELGRKVDFMRDVSEASGVNIVCATGLYHEQGTFSGLPPYFKMKSVDDLAGIFIKEITDGIGPDHIRPGVIKCATGPGLVTDNERKVLQAAARAHKATGVPITTHTTDGTMGPDQLDIFEGEGIDLRYVTVGHCSDSANLDYLRNILTRGAYVGFDRVGLEGHVSDEAKVGVVAALVAMGFTERIVLSHDHVGCMHGMRMTMMSDPEVAKKRSYTYLLREFLPKLKATGITSDTLNTMLVDNPRRYFEGG